MAPRTRSRKSPILPAKLLYYIPLSGDSLPAGLQQLDLLLLVPENGLDGTVYKLAKIARSKSHSIDIPFLSFHEPALAHVLQQALDDNFRPEIMRTRSMRSPIAAETTLTNAHYLYKAWLQYFRAIVLKLPMTSMARELSVHYGTYYRWEGSNRFLPPGDWHPILWKWWLKCLEMKSYYSKLTRVRLDEVMTPGERIDILKTRSPRRFFREDLMQQTEQLLNKKS